MKYIPVLFQNMFQCVDFWTHQDFLLNCRWYSIYSHPHLLKKSLPLRSDMLYGWPPTIVENCEQNCEQKCEQNCELWTVNKTVTKQMWIAYKKFLRFSSESGPIFSIYPLISIKIKENRKNGQLRPKTLRLLRWGISGPNAMKFQIWVWNTIVCAP